MLNGGGAGDRSFQHAFLCRRGCDGVLSSVGADRVLTHPADPIFTGGSDNYSAAGGQPGSWRQDSPPGLAPIIVEQGFEKIVRSKQPGVSLLRVEQRAAMVLAVAARACLLENGRVVLEDRSDRQQAPPLVNEY
jgi:hypothetical protein